jgi:hypothetical protein
MGWEIPAAAIVTAVIAIGGWVWRLAWKLASNEGKIQAAEILASNASARSDALAHELNQHKEHVATEYVSRDAMREVIDAINRLGDRLDKLFMHMLPKP